MAPDRLCKLELGFSEVIVDVKVGCQAERDLARIVFHATKQVVSQDTHCIHIDFKTIASPLIENFGCVELKAVKFFV